MLTLEKLNTIADRVKVSQLAQRKGMHPNKLAVKMSRGDGLTAEEVESLTAELKELAEDIRKAVR